MKTTFSPNIATALIAVMVSLSACATKPTEPAPPTSKEVIGGLSSEDAKSAECVTASIVGGLLGSMMADDKNTAKGAAAGAGIGMLGCVAVKANNRTNQVPAPAPAPAGNASATK